MLVWKTYKESTEASLARLDCRYGCLCSLCRHLEYSELHLHWCTITARAGTQKVCHTDWLSQSAHHVQRLHIKPLAIWGLLSARLDSDDQVACINFLCVVTCEWGCLRNGSFKTLWTVCCVLQLQIHRICIGVSNNASNSLLEDCSWGWAVAAAYTFALWGLHSNLAALATATEHTSCDKEGRQHQQRTSWYCGCLVSAEAPLKGHTGCGSKFPPQEGKVPNQLIGSSLHQLFKVVVAGWMIFTQS